MTEVKHLTLGSPNAPVKVESFINLACPYCKNYFKAADQSLKPLIDQGKVQHVIKHFDKTKNGLLKGTVANIHLDYQNTDETLEIIRKLYDTQKEWTVDFATIEEKMQKQFNLSPQKEADERSIAITEEAVSRVIKGIPTVFINDKKFEFNPLEDEQSTIETKLTQQINEANK
ncbi:thioredoxin domain-containing protein [Staphylococcus equorum]|uniref:thioredoxin domain-containing protein n=1 Tax=Staphylococcus equorum TaxID=246432 RepID=UPI002552F3BF|nr:thioredoxin domain-containing protein [Staphylococcus equorum]MDK9868220.1 thioredoxin domain-containing protein [Staphylococcus equorum]